MNDKISVRLKKGRFIHNIPNEMSRNDFLFILGSIFSHLSDNWGNKTFDIEIECDNDGKPVGSSSYIR